MRDAQLNFNQLDGVIVANAMVSAKTVPSVHFAQRKIEKLHSSCPGFESVVKVGVAP